MRMSITLFALLIGAAVARAEPGPAEAALDLKLFLETQARAEYRVLDFRIVTQEKLNEFHKHVRYEARIEFPTGLSPSARHALKGSEVKWIAGALDELSSKPVLIELSRKARFRKIFSRWSTLIDNTYVLVD